MEDRRAEQRFAELYRGQYSRVLSFVARRSANVQEAEDITADVFRVAWEKACAGTSISPGWLFGTARNVLRNHDRKVRRDQDLHASQLTEERARAAAHPVTDAVEAAVSVLASTHRDILMLAYWDQLNAKEIAAVLDLSVSAVWVRLHRARRAFKDAFKPLQET